MLAGYRISLVMPCRNEAEHLPQLIAEVPDLRE